MSLFEHISKQFHKPTGVGGKLVTFVMNRQNQQLYNGAELELKLHGTETVLDIGFGNGYLLNRLVGRYNCRFYGIDISSDMLNAASNRNRKHIDAGRMTLLIGSAENTGLADSLIDKAYTVNTVYFWSSLNAGLSEIWRILKPGGIFVNALYSKKMLDGLPLANKGYAKYEIDELLQAGKDNGFTVKVHPINLAPRESYCLVYTKAER